MQSRSSVEIVVPVYKNRLNEFELRSLQSTFRHFGGLYLLVLLKPAQLDTSNLEQQFPFNRIETFDDSFFDSINSYNRLMMSADFYRRFDHTEYILICQLDVFLFRNDLDRWLTYDYDYVGAPWVSKSKMGLIKNRFKMLVSKYLSGTRRERIYKYEIKGKIGNGGFSLRKVKTFVYLCTQLQEDMNSYLTNQHNLYFNEDLYFGVVPSRKGFSFKTPTVADALSFSFDIYPALLYKLSAYTLPMAAHGWYSKKHLPFWKDKVETAERQNS